MPQKKKINGETKDSKDEVKSTEIGGVIGASYTLINGFGFDTRYQLGLSDITKGDTEGVTFKNTAFLVGIHYKFSK